MSEQKTIGMQSLALETLGDLNDGLVRHAFAEALMRIRMDLQARRRLDKPRMLALVIRFDPMLDSAGFALLARRARCGTGFQPVCRRALVFIRLGGRALRAQG